MSKASEGDASPEEGTALARTDDNPRAPGWNVGWLKAMGVRVVTASAREVILELSVDEVHKQPFGLVHGGVHAGLVETGGAIGAQLAAEGAQVVGMENQTSFIRAVREGRLYARSTPVHVGRRTQLWETTISDEAQRPVAVGKLRVFCLPSE